VPLSPLSLSLSLSLPVQAHHAHGAARPRAGWARGGGCPSLSSLSLSLSLFLSKHTMRMVLLGRELAGPEEVGALRSPLLPTSLVDRFAQPCNRS
jgi:hypothetical protein